MRSFFLFAGEPSGDLHGSYLAHALKRQFPGCSLAGVAGPRMRDVGVEALLPTEKFEVMGFTDVLIALPALWKRFYAVRNAILKNQYDVVVLIDYPGFNLRLATALRKKGFKGKIVQYVCPTVWAHGKDRIGQMASTLDLLLTIFPFEAEYFAETALPVVYIGNPLQEYLQGRKLNPKWREKVGFSQSDEFVALFPGSREGEIARNLPVHLEAADALKQANPSLRFAISCAHPKTAALIAQAVRSTSLCMEKDVVTVPREWTDEMMSECRVALAKSGTVTLELALRERPTVVTYRLTLLNKFIAQRILKVNLPHYCIVNILGEEAVFPEFIDTVLLPKKIVRELRKLYDEGPARDACIRQCRHVKELLGDGASSHRAAEAIGGLFL